MGCSALCAGVGAEPSLVVRGAQTAGLGRSGAARDRAGLGGCRCAWGGGVSSSAPPPVVGLAPGPGVVRLVAARYRTPTARPRGVQVTGAGVPGAAPPLVVPGAVPLAPVLPGASRHGALLGAGWRVGGGPGLAQPLVVELAQALGVVGLVAAVHRAAVRGGGRAAGQQVRGPGIPGPYPPVVVPSAPTAGRDRPGAPLDRAGGGGGRWFRVGQWVPGGPPPLVVGGAPAPAGLGLVAPVDRAFQVPGPRVGAQRARIAGRPNPLVVQPAPAPTDRGLVAPGDLAQADGPGGRHGHRVPPSRGEQTGDPRTPPILEFPAGADGSRSARANRAPRLRWKHEVPPSVPPSPAGLPLSGIRRRVSHN